MIDKREALLFLLERCALVRVMVNARVAGVSLPAGVAEKFEYAVALDVGLNTPKPIDAFVVSDFGIRMRLSFDNAPHDVALPWASIYALLVRNEAHLVWMGEAPTAPTPALEKPPEKPRGGLRSV